METKQKSGGIIFNPGCSLACIFCGGRQKQNAWEIKNQGILVYQNLQDFKKQGIKNISISGSDPIEYENLIALIRYIKKEGFKFVDLSTNGTKLADPVFLAELIHSGLDRIRVPVYGSQAKIHDSITKTPGSFNQIITGLKNLLKKKAKIKIEVSCLICQQNKNDLFKLVDFINKLGIKDFYFSIPCLVAKRDYSAFYLPLKDLKPIVSKLYQYVLKANPEIRFLEIPFCIFGRFDPYHLKNKVLPPNLGKYNQPPEVYKTKIPDLPSYRLKKKVSFCEQCLAFDYCDGFFVNDLNLFGTGKLRPLKDRK